MFSGKIGFVGAGQMAQALARGFVQAGLADAGRLVAFDPYPAAAQAFAAKVGGEVATSNAAVAQAAEVIFLAVKPQSLADVMRELNGKLPASKLVISIIAGATLEKLSTGLGTSRVVRVMPNTPSLVGRGAAAYALAAGATAEDGKLAEQLLGAVGFARRVEEKLLDAVTGLSGSGPAFVYLMIEALSDGGVRMGLPRDLATALAAHTVRGAAEMVIQEQEHPAVLKDRVASPGGTTIAGLAALEERGLRGALIAAVEAASQRSQELGRA
jgi:pyrroline-5-carboxylate reductase